MSERLPGGQLKAQRLALRDEFRRIVRRARLLDMQGPDLHELLDKALEETDDLPDLQQTPSEKRP